MSDESHVDMDVQADFMDDQQVDVAIQTSANQHDMAVQVSMNQLDEVSANQFLVGNNTNPLVICDTSNSHQQINNVPHNCSCAHPPNYLISSLPLPSYQVSRCCGINCNYHRVIVTCLCFNQLETLFTVIYSEAFCCNVGFHTDDSLDR